MNTTTTQILIDDNMRFKGLSRLNDGCRGNKSSTAGWVVRETLDPENPDKSKALELGMWLKDDVFLSVPVDFKLKYKFSLIGIDKENNFKYYSIPASIEFGIKKFTSKTTGKEKIFLVAPDDNTPRVYICCYAFESKSAIILSCDFDENTKILRKYLEQDRSIVGVILASEKDDVNIKLVEGIPNATSASVRTINFKEGTLPTPDVADYTPEDGARFEQKFISFPMYLEEPKRENKERNTEKKPFKKFNKK